LYELSLRFKHDCPYNNLSAKFPDAHISLWDNLHKEFLDVRSSDKREWSRISSELETFARRKGSRILRKTSDGKGYQFMIMTCACERKGTTLDMIMESDCLFVPPITFHDGWETYHVIAFDSGAVRRLLKKFGSKGKVELVTQKKVDVKTFDQLSVIPLPDPLAELTPMQLNALATSMAFGYYRKPRRTSTGKIAAALRIPRTTFQDHRNKAESKLMSALAPYVLTYVGRRAQGMSKGAN
jgi:predicted DNA binding protein